MIDKYVIQTDKHSPSIGVMYYHNIKRIKVGAKKYSWMDVEYIIKVLTMKKEEKDEHGDMIRIEILPAQMISNHIYIIVANGITIINFMEGINKLKANGYLVNKVKRLGRIMR